MSSASLFRPSSARTTPTQGRSQQRWWVRQRAFRTGVCRLVLDLDLGHVPAALLAVLLMPPLLPLLPLLLLLGLALLDLDLDHARPVVVVVVAIEPPLQLQLQLQLPRQLRLRPHELMIVVV